MTDNVDPTIIPEQKPFNPLLERLRLPGEIHQLPSGGLLYTNGELDPSVKNGEIQIHPMTAIDEVVMRSPDLMFSGDAVDQVISHCVPHVLKPRRLLQKDVDFILAVLRKVSYGEKFEMSVKHTCEGAKEHKYQIPMDQFIKGAKKLNADNLTKEFNVKMPNDQVVTIRPIRYEDVVELMQTTDADKDLEQRAEELVKVLVLMTDNIDGVSEREQILEWYKEIPAGWSDHINKAIDTATDWGPDFGVSIKCKDCEKEFKLSAPLNPVSFFF